jgi:hypothetical protein
MQYIPHFEWQSKKAFGEWLNTAPKHEVLPYLKRALANAKSMRNTEAISQIQAVINQVEKE